MKNIKYFAFLFLLLTSISSKALILKFENRTNADVVFNPYVLRGLEGAVRAMSGRKILADVAQIIKENPKNIIVKFASRVDIDDIKEKKNLIVPAHGALELRFEDAGDALLCLDPTNLWIQIYKNNEFSIPKKAPLHVIKTTAEKRRKISEALQSLAEKSEKISDKAQDISNEDVKAVTQASSTVLQILPDFFKVFEDKRCDNTQTFYLYKLAKAERADKIESNYYLISFE